MTEVKSDGNRDSGIGIEGTRKRNRERLMLVAALLLVSITFGAAGKMTRDPAGMLAGLPVATPKVSKVPPSLRYSAPSAGPVYFSGQLDRGAVLQGGDGFVNLELAIRADADSSAGVEAVRPPIDLVVVLDRSGSMAGAALAHAVASVSELIAPLGPRDRFSLVTYSSDARLDVPLSLASDAAKTSWSRILHSQRAQGGTNLAIGLDLANAEVKRLREAGRPVRVILLSDGHANEGDHSHAGLRARAAAAVQGEYVLSAVGVGDGFDEQLMTMLADAGTGNFYYVRDLAQLAGVFAGEFASARETVAQALEVRIEPAQGVELLDAAGYPLERTADGLVSFRPGALFAGQDRRIWLRFRADTRQLGDRAMGRVSVRYVADGESHDLAFSSAPQFACVEAEGVFHASVDKDAWARNVATDRIGEVMQSVSRALEGGDVAAARSSVSHFMVEAQRENEHYANEHVEQSIEDARAMAAELDAAIAEGPAAQNALRKKLSADGYDGRRSGAKYR